MSVLFGVVLVICVLVRSSNALSVPVGSAERALENPRTAPFLNNDIPSFDQFASGLVPLVCLRNAVDVTGIKDDVLCLKAAGFGAQAGVVSQTDEIAPIRSNVHQIWLQTPNEPPLNTFVGNLDARKSLLQLVEGIRIRVAPHFGTPPDQVELSYLYYQKGAYYAKHVDVATSQRQGASKRVVSFLLYLGKPNGEPWEPSDGGALRVYDDFAHFVGEPVMVDDSTVYSEIAPEAGTLVLFDSSTVPHEVRPTQCERLCVVGWFRSASSSTTE